jgi:uncharacterized protein (TIGR03437 family)
MPTAAVNAAWRWKGPFSCYVCSLRVHRFVPPFVLFPVLAGVLYGQALFVKPVKVLGDPNFIGTAANPLAYDSSGPNWVEGRELNSPQGIALDNSVSPPIVYIADTGNNRVLAYHYATQLTAGAPADLILGQPDRFTNLPQGPNGASLTTGLHAPTGLAVDSAGNLYVADSGDNRILRYPKPFAQPAGYQFPDLIIGQTSFTSSAGDTGGVTASTLLLTNGNSFFPHTGMAFDSAGNLWVADIGNHRVLRFPVSVLSAGKNAPAADTVIGQVNLVSNVAATDRTSTSGLFNPSGVAFDAAGNMLVADSLARVLVFPPGSGTHASAIRILGIAMPTAAQPNPPAVSDISVGDVTSAIGAGTDIVVVDSSNNRVLVFPAVSAWPPQITQFSPSAISVIGQTTFSNSMSNQGGAVSATTLSSPVDAAASATEVFVVDSGNNRVLIYPIAQPSPGTTSTRVIGQLGFAYNAPNLAIGQEFFTAGPANAVSGSAILDLGATPPHLYVADTANNRVLGFKNFTSLANGQVADLVIGQPDLLHTTVNYPTNIGTTPNAQGLNAPTSVAVDSAGNLYVADAFNSRVLRFPAPFASGVTGLETADLVLGQSDFVSIVTDPTARTMSVPVSIAFTVEGANVSKANSGYLVVTDANHNRVLLFAKPLSNGMSAALVLGQSSFNGSAASATASGLSSPLGVAVDPMDNIVVSDTGNARVEVFGPALSNGAGPSFALNAGFTSPLGIGMAPSGEFWVADGGQNHLLHFPSVSQLALFNYASDATLPAVSPRSAFVDSHSNLLVADGINRLLYYAPQVAVVNAANYIPGRPLAPGAIAAIFPSISTNIIAGGMASAPSGVFPLPTTLANTQVIVNHKASSLFFVSPGQINLPLSMSLPSAGTVDLQVIQPATGQVYGGAELDLSSASPGLFTSTGTGSGEVAALNVVDGTINSATNPVARGAYITLYGTGQGFVANAPADGTAGAGPIPTSVNPQILLGGAFLPAANIEYSGLAPDLVGVWQINFQIPTTTTPGNSVPIIVLMNSIPSDNPSVPGQIAATIAVK